jgi:predicted amidophosphoribosyltransferase
LSDGHVRDTFSSTNPVIFKTKMKHVRCNACSSQWSGTDTYCPRCGAPSLNRPRNIFGDALWFAAVLTLLIWLVKYK